MAVTKPIANERPNGMNDKSKLFSADVPLNARSLFIKARSGVATRSQAIRAMCSQCMGYSDYVKRIRSCDSNACPLWSYRPYQKKSLNESR